MPCELELECGICYRLFDVGRRCPRQLGCKHSFCESCLLTLAALRRDEQQSGSWINCAFCRHATALTEEKPRDNFPVDQDILERLVAAGDDDDDDDDDDDEEPRMETTSQSKEEHFPRTRGGRLWLSMKRLYNKVKGQNRQDCITDAEMRDLALMSCYMI